MIPSFKSRVDKYSQVLKSLVTDLQQSSEQRDNCSYLECDCKPDKGRFPLYIEHDDPRIAVFAACFGIQLIDNYFAGRLGEDDPEMILALAKLILNYPETRSEISRTAHCLAESVDNIDRAIRQLSGHNFRITAQ